ncbi:MAG: hypothetical protein SFY56_11170 [Bacteroidota bacterium]|nr:hypothetical protein [Bacteroidota bacterium]
MTLTSTKAKNVTGASKELKKFVLIFENQFQFTELYTGKNVTSLNVEDVSFQFLRVR